MFIKPTSDIFVKYLLGRQETNDLLLDFINTVLTDSEFPAVKEVKIQNPFQIRPLPLEKEPILDIEAKDEAGRLYDIEIQNTQEREFVDRSLFYWAKIYSRQLEQGQSYRTLKPVICINLLNFTLFERHPRAHSCFLLFEKGGDPETILTDHLQLHFCEISKLKDLAQGHLKSWLEYFSIEGRKDKEDEMQVLLQEKPLLQKAHQAYEIFTQDDDLRRLYEAQEKAQRDIATRLEDAEERGKLEGKLEGLEEGMEKVAKKMKQQGFDTQTIQELTGLSLQQISQL